LPCYPRRWIPRATTWPERCKVRTILSEDTTGLGAQIATTLVSDFGLTPDEADALVPPELVTDAMKAAREERERLLQPKGFAPETLGTPGFGQPPEHERARDAETGRYVAQEATWTEPAREA
jgi:hypothetical protein